MTKMGRYRKDGAVASVCRSGDLAPEQAWVSLWDLLNDDPRTKQELRWSTDVRWNYGIEEY